jgi:hypothetical protein
MALTLTTATKDINVTDAATVLEVWIDGLTINNIYGFTCVAISNTRYRYTILYA